jgi:hypothetical protein
MIGIRRLFLAICVSALAALPSSAQEAVSSVSISGHGGLINSPTDFDADRTVDYGSGVRFGGGLTLQLYERLSIRSEASFTFGSGTDTTGGINEEVTLDRSYFGGGVEFLLAVGKNYEPYLYGGGGLIIADRVGQNPTSYAYDVTEFTAVLGGGVRYLMGSNSFVFVDGTSWTYNNAVTDKAQVDTSVSVGFGYRWGGN